MSIEITVSGCESPRFYLINKLCEIWQVNRAIAPYGNSGSALTFILDGGENLQILESSLEAAQENPLYQLLEYAHNGNIISSDYQKSLYPGDYDFLRNYSIIRSAEVRRDAAKTSVAQQELDAFASELRGKSGCLYGEADMFRFLDSIASKSKFD